VALENKRSDETLLPQIEKLASLMHSEVLLVHVADGWVARNFNNLKLCESEEMKDDRVISSKPRVGWRRLELKYPTIWHWETRRERS